MSSSSLVIAVILEKSAGRFGIALVALIAAGAGTATAEPPEDFPRFVVPGYEAEMASLRELYWLHYPGSGPKATLWDEWLTAPSLWPAVETDGALERFVRQWRDTLSSRAMDDEGYVATHQHASIAHQLGWPFPFWAQGGPGAWGWHFSLAGVPEGWHGTEEKDRTGWELDGADDEGIANDAWRLELTAPGATLTTPRLSIDAFQAPFMQLRWMASALDDAQPYLEWTTESESEFSHARRFYFAPIASETAVYTMVPVYRHPEWRGTISRIRIGLGNGSSEGAVGIQAFFTQYDTRHNINNSNFVRGCSKYFLWTGDLNFLREQLPRMRRAIRYVMSEFKTLEEDVILTEWIGHDGRPGIQRDPDGKKPLQYGHGIGNNYWDLLPFGHKDTYATIQYYDALQHLIAIERAVMDHPEWNMPKGAGAFDPDELAEHAAQVKQKGNASFWSDATGRFTAGIDADGNAHDYGFTFLNLEAVHYEFATEPHAASILDWIAGERIVDGDTAQDEDIYHWRFGPRATTKRNLDYYGWYWSNPESIPWGGQVQDGGTVLGFTYFDLMSRLKTRGPDDAWERLQEIVAWFDEVQSAGGYRRYYDGRDGTLQGGGTAGGLGCDREFFESVLVPQIMLDGFLGFRPAPDGFHLEPKLPSEWPGLTVTRIALRDVVFDIEVTPKSIRISVRQGRPTGRAFETLRTAGEGWRGVSGQVQETHAVPTHEGASINLVKED